MRIRSDSSTAQREIQALRRELATLRGQLDQTERSADGAGNEIDQLGDESQQTATQIGRMGDAAQRTSRETQGLTRGVGAATGGTQVFTRSLSGLGSVLGGLGLVAAGAGVFRVGANSVEASVKVEGFRNSLTALYGDAQIANTVLADLQKLSLLPGITFESAVQGAVRLKTVGVEGVRAEGVIREFGNAAALAGASSVELGRSLVGFTQILSRGKVSQEEINQVLEAVPLIGVSIREAFGSIDAETIRAQLDAAGQGVQDFTDILVNQLSKGARASADSTRNAFSNLENATFRLHAAIGERLSPAVREATGFLTELANTTADFVAGTNDATRSATSYADALMTASTAAAVNTAIQERIKFLEQERAALEESTEAFNVSFSRRGQETDLGTQYREAGEELTRLTAALNNTTAAAEHFGNVQNQLLSEARDITQTITDLETRRAGETARAYGQTTREIREQREALAETQKEIGENAVVLRALASANTVVTAATEKTTAATEESTKAVKEATVEIITYAEAIRQVQANIEAYVEEQALITDFGTFWEIAAGHADGYSTAIDFTTTSVVNLKNELDALTAIFNEQNVVINENGVLLDEETQALLRYLATLDALEESLANVERGLDAHNAALVNPAVSDAVRSLRAYNDVLSDTGVAFETIDSISDRLTQSIRDQASAFDDLRADVDTAEISLDNIDETFNRIPDPIDTAIVSMEDFETVALRALRDIGGELSAFEGNLGGIGIGIDNLVTLFSNPVSFAAGTLGAVIEGLSNINEFGGALGLPEGFFDDPVPGQARVNPQNIVQNEQRAADQVHQAGIARNLNVDDPLAQIEILRGNDPGIFQRHNTRAFIEENFPELVDVIYPSTETTSPTSPAGRSTAQQPNLRALTDVQSAYIQSLGFDPSQYGYDSRRNAFVKTAQGNGPTLLYDDSVAFDEARTAQAPAGSELGTPSATAATPDPLGTFSLTRGEREDLAPYQTAVREAENAIEDLTEDSTPQEIADAYQALVFAQTNLSNISEGIIRAAAEAERITGTAATNAITNLGLDLGDDLRTANNSLISTLGDVGFEVVGGIENIREAIDVSDISSAFRRIPEEVEAAAGAEPEPEAEPDVLAGVHRFSGAESRRLGILRTNVDAAEDAVRLLDENSTEAEITAAYTDLADAERDLYATQIGFIQSATGITEEARQDAFTLAEGVFGRELFDANQKLVRALGDVGLTTRSDV